MKKTIFITVFFSLTLLLQAAITPLPNNRNTAFADSIGPQADTTTPSKSIEAIMVSATRAGSAAPIAQTTVGRAEIQIQNTGRDLPVLLQFQPGITITSDAGAGIGYTGIRVRGSDATRTNVTINGVPINDAESHGTFWVNMPDMASGLASVQVQRGAGTSTNGAGAFGASVNMQTYSSNNPYVLVSNSGGSFNTLRHSISAGTGLINQHWTVDVKLSAINSDGFVDRANSKLRSYMTSVGYQHKNWSAKWLSFGGKEQTYQAWWGVPKEKLFGSSSDLLNHYYRNLGVTYRNPADSINLFNSNPRSYNYYNYASEVDDYTQNHHHLYLNINTGKNSQLYATGYFTHGFGFFEQFKPQDKLSNYLLPPTVVGTDTLFRSDIVRRRWLDNTLLGTNVNWNYHTQRFNFILGAGLNQYQGKHFGRVIWASAAPSASPNHPYYNGRGNKTDATIFAKLNHEVSTGLHAWIDLQYRQVSHRGTGTDNDLRAIDFNGNFGFFNPKAGLMYQINANSFYGSMGIAQREPSRSDFTDHKSGDIPKPEKLTDWELGWSRQNEKTNLFVNLYYMKYKNQLVLTGEVNDVGSALRRNAEASFRRGIEAGFEIRPIKHVTIGGNIALSQNKIKSITNVIPDYFTYVNKDSIFRNVPIAMSPAVNAGAWLEYQLPGQWNIRYLHKFVSRQYLDNTGDRYRSLNPYQFAELWLQKTFMVNKGTTVSAQLQILNLFNSKYSSNGYTFMYTYGSRDITQEVFLYPQATRHMLGGIVIKF